MGIKKVLGSISPLAGAVTGKGLFGGLRDISPAMMAIDAVKKKKRKLGEPASSEEMKRGGKVKKKKYADGGITYVSNPVVQKLPDDYKSSEKKDEPAPKKDEPKSFKEAFAAARKEQGANGSFTWNGKKYSTAMAGDKKSAPAKAATSSTPAKSASAKSAPAKPTDKLARFKAVRAARSSSGPGITVSRSKAQAKAAASTSKANARKAIAKRQSEAQNRTAAMGLKPARFRKPTDKQVKREANRYAKGGKVRGDGCCTKGHTKGRMR